jgi:hypothetical protein
MLAETKAAWMVVTTAHHLVVVMVVRMVGWMAEKMAGLLVDR